MPLRLLKACLLSISGIVMLSSCAPTQEPVAPPHIPSIYTPVTVQPWAENPVEFYATEYVSSLTLEEKIQSLLFLNYPGTDPTTLTNYIVANQPGGFILMGSNIPATPQELAGLTASISGNPELPLLIGIDEEGGDVTRLPYDTFAGANTLRNEPVEVTAQAFSDRAQLLASTGVTVNFGVVADISADPNSFIYYRSFGSDAQSTSERVSAAVTAENDIVSSTVKHYPGHGSAPGDSHFAIPVSPLDKQTWLASDAIPFQAGIDAGTEFVMFGHVAMPSVDATPASLSPTWHHILRDEQGFEGIAITDDLMMLQNTGLTEYADPAENSIKALEAGNDVLLFVPKIDFDPSSIVSAVSAAVSAGRITEAQISRSAIKVAHARRLNFPQATEWVPQCDMRCFVATHYGE